MMTNTTTRVVYTHGLRNYTSRTISGAENNKDTHYSCIIKFSARIFPPTFLLVYEHDDIYFIVSFFLRDVHCICSILLIGDKKRTVIQIFYKKITTFRTLQLLFIVITLSYQLNIIINYI